MYNRRITYEPEVNARFQIALSFIGDFKKITSFFWSKRALEEDYSLTHFQFY